MSLSQRPKKGRVALSILGVNTPVIVVLIIAGPNPSLELRAWVAMLPWQRAWTQRCAVGGDVTNCYTLLAERCFCYNAVG